MLRNRCHRFCDNGKMRVGEIDISIEAEAWHKIEGIEAFVAAGIRACLQNAAPDRAERASVSVLLCDNARMQALNKSFRGFDKPTNVLSFPAAASPGDASFLGDLALGFEICQEEARDAGKSMQDHLTHLVVHGVLHLIGYDHQDDLEAERMETREIAILSSLGIQNPYSGAEGGAPDE
jgi:probable rRNA maturation factor